MQPFYNNGSHTDNCLSHYLRITIFPINTFIVLFYNDKNYGVPAEIENLFSNLLIISDEL